jgi:phosphoesterase RecJ-like protein
MSNEASIAALLDLIHERRSFVVTSHSRPDGDAIGSSLGLMHLLEAMGKRVTVAFADPIPAAYNCLPGVERIVRDLPADPDAAILLECDCIERSSYDRAQFEAMNASLVINIDHHLTGCEFAAFNWIDPEACAVGAMIYDLAIASGMGITPEMAECLYTAILTDTGSFTHPTTAASTFAMAAHLVESGANVNKISQAMYFSTPPAKLRLLGAALNKLTIDRPSHGKIAWSSITLDDMEHAGATVEDCEGVINHLIGMAGVEAAVFLREMSGSNSFRLSLRSKGEVDVAALAKRFGGGGHRRSSGCTVEGTLVEVTGRVISALRDLTESSDPAAGLGNRSHAQIGS